MKSLSKCNLFRGIDSSQINHVLECMGAYQKKYHKKDIIFNVGESVSVIALVLKGSIFVYQYSFWGDQNIINKIERGEVFAESFSCANEPLSVEVQAEEESEILFFKTDNLLNIHDKTCMFHQIMIHNLLTIMAKKNLKLTKKINHMSQKKIREKLLSYLSEQSFSHQSNQFDIPFNQQELADFLCVDRSALSSALGKLKKEGILDFNHAHFTIYE